MLEYPPTSGLVKRPAQVSLWGKKSIKIRSNKNSSRIKSWKTLSLINYQKTLKSKSKSKRPAEASLQGRKSNKKPLQTKLEYQLQIIKSVIKWHFKGRSSTWCGNFQPPHVIATSQVEMIIHNHDFDEKQTKSDNDHICAFLPSGFKKSSFAKPGLQNWWSLLASLVRG